MNSSTTRLDQAVTLFSNARAFDLTQTDACIQLMREYLRREAIWAKRLGVMDQLPFANLPLAIDPIIAPEAMYERLSRAFSRSSVEDRCCLYMLHWYRLEKEKPTSIQQWGLPDPYLPLLAFFRKKGYFTTEHSVYVDVNQQKGIHSRIVQHGDLSAPFAQVEQ